MNIRLIKMAKCPQSMIVLCAGVILGLCAMVGSDFIVKNMISLSMYIRRCFVYVLSCEKNEKICYETEVRSSWMYAVLACESEEAAALCGGTMRDVRGIPSCYQFTVIRLSLDSSSYHQDYQILWMDVVLL